MKKVRLDSWERRQYGSTASKQRVGHVRATEQFTPTQMVQHHGEGMPPQQPRQSNLLLYSRGAQRQRDDLNISITAAPNAGMHPFQFTVPRLASTRHPRTSRPDSRQVTMPPPPASSGKNLSDGAKFLNPLPSRPPTSKATSNTHDPLPPIAAASTKLLECMSDSSTECDSDMEGYSQDSEEVLALCTVKWCMQLCVCRIIKCNAKYM